MARQRSAKPPTAVRICSVPPNPAWRDFHFSSMLTQEEQAFIRYWAEKRNGKKRSLRQFTIGLPLGVIIVFALFANMLSGWHKRADMTLQNNSSLIMVILIAGFGIVVFMTIFSKYHQWDQQEQRYQELLQKANKNDHAA